MHCVKEIAISKWVERHVEKLSGVGWWEQWAGRRGHSGVGCRAATLVFDGQKSLLFKVSRRGAWAEEVALEITALGPDAGGTHLPCLA